MTSKHANEAWKNTPRVSGRFTKREAVQQRDAIIENALAQQAAMRDLYRPAPPTSPESMARLYEANDEQYRIYNDIAASRASTEADNFADELMRGSGWRVGLFLAACGAAGVAVYWMGWGF